MDTQTLDGKQNIIIANCPTKSTIDACDHHVQAEFCTTRAAYRQGKELKAVKVYTINDESQHLLIHNVPSIGLLQEVKRLAAKYGKTETVKLITDYPRKEDFTHVYYVKYSHLNDARQAKKRLDNRSFFGSLLHICYAPELESVDECKKKIKDRICSIQKSWKFQKPKNNAEEGKCQRQIAASSSASITKGTWSNLVSSSSSKIVPSRSSSLRTRTTSYL